MAHGEHASTRLFRTLLVLALSCAAPLAASAQAPAVPVRTASIEQASWLAGRWVGEGLGGRVEETWAPPQGGQMIGHFSYLREGRPALYELMLLDVHEGGLRLRVKHFNPDFTGWEQRDQWHTFSPQSAAAGDLRFNGIRYRREGAELVVTVTMRSGSAAPRDEILRFRRAPL